MSRLQTMLKAWPALVLATALALAAGCDYPEQGCYSLIAFDGYGMPVTSRPFLVDELVDDTGMTYAFTLAWPVDGELAVIDLADASDETRRAWLATLTGEVTAAGELDLLLSHSAELLSFGGAYQPVAGEEAPVYPLAGFVRSDDTGRSGRVHFNGGLPPLPLELAECRSFELRRISEEEFEEALGCAIGDAVRREAAPRDGLEVNAEVTGEPTVAPADEEPEPAEEETAEEDQEPVKPREKQKTPPLGGRSGTRPR